jgi:nicotinamide-nucleotide amidase
MSDLPDLLGAGYRQVADLLDVLRERGETVAAAESLTAGMVTAALTSVAGSSAVVRGGLVVYATDLKATLAGVDRELLARRGAVHPDVAAALAEGARGRCLATWGIGLTGVAGPDPQDGVPPGTVHLAVTDGGRTRQRELNADGDRHDVRRTAVGAAVTLLTEAVLERG